MSHTVIVDIEMKDRSAIEAACRRLELTAREGTHRIYNTEAKGIGIHLKKWNYPIVIRDGETIIYDNHNGNWGDIEQLNEFKAYYGLEAARNEIRRNGHNCYEITLENNEEIGLVIEGV